MLHAVILLRKHKTDVTPANGLETLPDSINDPSFPPLAASAPSTAVTGCARVAIGGGPVFGRLHAGRGGARALRVDGRATSAGSAGTPGPQAWDVRHVMLQPNALYYGVCLEWRPRAAVVASRTGRRPPHRRRRPSFRSDRYARKRGVELSLTVPIKTDPLDSTFPLASR